MVESKSSLLHACNINVKSPFGFFRAGYCNRVRPWEARFFGKEKTCAAQNSCNFCYLILIGWRLDDQKPCCSRFSLHKFVHLKLFWTQFKNVHLQGPCSLRPCISRPYCTWNFVFSFKMSGVILTSTEPKIFRMLFFIINQKFMIF